MLKTIKSFFVIAICSLFVYACSSSNSDEMDDTISIDTDNNTLDSQKISAQNVFNAVPARTEILSLTQGANAEYNPMILNNPDDASKYLLESSRALNLGVYGTDLNVTSVFEQTQESITFFKSVSSISKSLGLSNCFDEKMGDRMEANKDNRDSTLEIISQSFKNADTYLKANGRPGTSSLIVAGAWIEGLYIACNTAKETKNEGIVKKIWEQGESLKYLVELMESSKLPAETNYILPDLKALKTVFDSKPTVAHTIESIKDIDSKITALRTKVISTK